MRPTRTAVLSTPETQSAWASVRSNSSAHTSPTTGSRYGQPYGAGRRSVQYTLRGIATKYLGGSERSPRLHLNISWYRLAQPGPGQRADQLELAVGHSRLVSDSTALVVDVVHGAKPERRARQTIVDVGVRHEIGDGWAVSLGVGAGIAQQSPALRAFFAVRKSLRVF